MISIFAQIRCVERELGLRRQVYARFVAQGRMSKETADKETDEMEAVLATLKSLAPPNPGLFSEVS